MKIILGSASKWRKGVIDTMGFEYEVMSPDIDEKAIRLRDPDKLVLALAEAKAKALLTKVKEPALIITGDQVVVWNGQISEKPQNEKEAGYFLESYCEHPAETHSAVMVTNTANGKHAMGVDVARVYFKNIPKEIIDEVVKKGAIYTTAGGIQMEDALLAPYIERIDGTVDSLKGLPKALLTKLMEEVK